MFTLRNHSLVFSLDEKGRLVSLLSRKTGRDYAGGEGLWRIVYQKDRMLEEIVRAEEAEFRCEAVGGDRLDLSYRWAGGFEVDVRVRLEDDVLLFDADLSNRSDRYVLREFQFPYVEDVRIAKRNRLVRTTCGGQMFDDIPAFVQGHHTAYIGPDNEAIQAGALYPVITAMNFYLLDEFDGGLYVGSHDRTFRYTFQLLRKRGEKIDACLVKYPFLEPGAKARVEGYALAPYAGTWHKGADLYKRWLETWFERKEVPASIRESTGWQRMILRHQHGNVLFRYDQLPEIYEAGRQAGIDTILVFGWHTGGMDSRYPEYTCDESQGGLEGLRKQVAAVQRAGGKVIVYFNGQLIDCATPFYRETGHKVSLKLMNGTECRQTYPFGGSGTALRVFGNKTFAVACPGAREWREVLKRCVDRAVEIGADGVFFDQLGSDAGVPCSDPTHGHPVPMMNHMAVKGEMMKELRATIKARAPEMSFGVELISDVAAQYADFIHGLVGPSPVNRLDVARYVIPDLITTDREIRDDTDIEPRVNRAVVYGLRSDVEIYRCRATIDETPHYKAYLTKVNALRRKYAPVLFHGDFRDTVGAVFDRPEVEYGVTVTADRICVVATLVEAESVRASLRVEGAATLDSYDGTGSFDVGGDGPEVVLSLRRNALVVLAFTRRPAG